MKKEKNAHPQHLKGVPGNLVTGSNGESWNAFLFHSFTMVSGIRQFTWRGILILFFIPGLASLGLSAHPKDSLRTTTFHNKKFILHKVEKGEGLLAIARRYNVNADEIVSEKSTSKKLSVGDLLLIPLKESKNDSLKKNESIDESHANADSREATVYKHKVVKGETLNKIAQLYGVSLPDLIKWNNIRDNRIDPGQDLVVNRAAAILPYKPWNKPFDRPGNMVGANTNTFQNGCDEVEETGFARVIENASASVNAEVTDGIILITNLENGKQALVKINTSGTGEIFKDNVILVLNRKNADELAMMPNAIGRVSVKYLTKNNDTR